MLKYDETVQYMKRVRKHDCTHMSVAPQVDSSSTPSRHPNTALVWLAELKDIVMQQNVQWLRLVTLEFC